MNGADQQVVRWYTRARRFPQLIGRTPDGARIPGGPYTITQVATAGVLMLIALKTTSLWAHYGLIGNGLLLAGVVHGVVFLLGKIPLGSRSPLAIGAGAWRALSAPTTGRLGGRPVRLRRPHRVQHRMTVFIPATVAVSAKPTPLDEPVPAPRPAATAEPAPAASQADLVVDPMVEPVHTGTHRAEPVKTSRRRTKGLSNLGHRRPAPPTAEPVTPTVQPPDTAPTQEPASAPSRPTPPVPAPAASAPALSGVQALLARNAASSPASIPPTTPRST